MTYFPMKTHMLVCRVTCSFGVWERLNFITLGKNLRAKLLEKNKLDFVKKHLQNLCCTPPTQEPKTNRDI